jgi:cobaltochelatase CobN
LSNPRRPRQTSLEKYMGQELQTRYLNPRWADGMLREGYAGARFINRVVDYLWAWQVTVPEAVDAGKWQRMYDTYIADRHGLNVRERFKGSGNLRAYQAITDRMLSAIERGYWKPSDAVRQELNRQNTQAINEAGIACGADACSHATLRQAPNLLAQTSAAVRSAVAAAAAPAPEAPAGTQAGEQPQSDPRAAKPAAAKAKPAAPAPAKDVPTAKVSGFEMETLNKLTPAEKTIGTLVLLALATGLMGAGYWRRSCKK